MGPGTGKQSTEAGTETPLGDHAHVALSDSPLRQDLHELSSKAGDAVLAGNAERATRLYAELASKANMEILEQRNPCEDLNYLCADYTLATQLKVSWYPPEDVLALFDNPIEFLEEQGFEVVPEPRNGDLAVYLTLSSERAPIEMHHIGLVMDGRVESKLNYGPIVAHDFESVPSGFGEILVFFRADSTNLNEAIFSKLQKTETQL